MLSLYMEQKHTNEITKQAFNEALDMVKTNIEIALSGHISFSQSMTQEPYSSCSDSQQIINQSLVRAEDLIRLADECYIQLDQKYENTIKDLRHGLK